MIKIYKERGISIILSEKLSTQFSPGTVIKVRSSRFPDGSEGERLARSGHPFVVMDSDNVCVISSVENKVSDRFPYNIEIKDSDAAGLNKANSHVKTDRRTEIDDDDVFQVIGHLSNKDYNDIKKRFDQVPLNQAKGFDK